MRSKWEKMSLNPEDEGIDVLFTARINCIMKEHEYTRQLAYRLVKQNKIIVRYKVCRQSPYGGTCTQLFMVEGKKGYYSFLQDALHSAGFDTEAFF